MRLFAFSAAAFAILTYVTPSLARVEKFPPGTRTEYIKTDGATIYVRVGGKGPAVVLLHGFGDTGDMWAPRRQGADQGSYGRRPRFARHGSLGDIRRAATTRKRRPATSPRCLTS